MAAETHSQIASFIWSICNLLRGPYKRNEYRKVILPLTVLRRFDCILAPTKAKVLHEHTLLKAKGENIIRHRLSQLTGVPFYNLSRFTFSTPPGGGGLNGLLDDPNQLAPNLNRHFYRHFYRYEPPRPLEVIEEDIKRLEGEIVRMLHEVTA